MFEPAILSAALTSLKVILDLAKNANDAHLSMKISSEVASIQGRLIDVQQQTLELQTENQDLKAKIQASNDDTAFRDSLEFDPVGIYKRQGPRGLEQYCSACLDRDHVRVRVTGGSSSPFCHVHGYRG